MDFQSFKRKFLFFLGLVLLVGIALGAYATFGSYSDGVRQGHIVKFSSKGAIIKTWEGQLNPDCNRVGNNPIPWEFSVSDNAVAKDVNKASLDGGCINLHYKEKFYKLPWLGDTKYFIYKVEPAVNAPQPHFGN